MQSVEEREAMLRSAGRAASGRCTLLAHVGAIGTAATLALARAAADAGYDAVSAIPPFYYGFSAAELAAHYRALAEATPLPVILAAPSPPRQPARDRPRHERRARFRIPISRSFS